MQPIGQGRADAGVILVVAGALDFHGLTVEEETLLRVECERADTKVNSLGVVHSTRGLHGYDRRIQIRTVRRPEGRRGQVGGGGEYDPAPRTYELWVGLSGGDRSAHCIQDLPVHRGMRIC